MGTATWQAAALMPETDVDAMGLLIAARVQQEWLLRDSFERRAQFLVGAAATGSSLVVAGAGLLAKANQNLDKPLESLLLWAGGLQLAVGVVALLVLVPLRIRTVTVASLEGALSEAVAAAERGDSCDGGAVAAVGNAQAGFLRSLERANAFKVFVLFLASLLELAALSVLGLAILKIIDTF